MGATVPSYRRTLAQRLRLEGRRCGSCAEIHFPPKASCPGCGGKKLEPYILSGRGTVYAVTEIAPAGAPPELGEGGYHAALIALAEGPRITAQLTGRARIGEPVRFVLRRLYEEDGVVRYGFKFQPLGAEE